MINNPEMLKTSDSFAQAMPELMASFGMRGNTPNLLGFMVSYLYGFILLIFPKAFCILRGNALIAKYIDRGSMTSLVAAPVKRHTIAFTQMGTPISGILLLIFYITVLELDCARIAFPGELDIAALCMLNSGLRCCRHVCAFCRWCRTVCPGACSWREAISKHALVIIIFRKKDLYI